MSEEGQQAPRRVRPELTEEALDHLLECWGTCDQENPEEVADLGALLVQNGWVLIADSRDRKKLLEKMRRITAKSGRRRSQLRQVNKSMILLQQQAQNWYRQYAMERKDHEKSKAELVRRQEAIVKMDELLQEKRQQLDEQSREIQRLRGETRERAFQV